jgi:3-oxoacyl-[acyl-carrier protein] reductase
MKVAVCTHGEKAATKTIETLGEIGNHCIPLGCEMNDPEDMRAKFRYVADNLGGIDVLITYHGRSAEYNEQAIETLTPEYVDKTVSNHLTSCYNLAREAVPYLKNSRAGRIIFTATSDARMGGKIDAMGVTMAKGGTISLTYSLAKRLCSDSITVNCIAVGGLLNIPASLLAPQKEWIKPEDIFDPAMIPIGRVGKPEDVAAAICYLASEEAGYVTGAVLNVSGGLYMG